MVRSLTLGRFGSLMQLQATYGLHPTSFIRRGYLAGDISANSQARWFQQFNGPRRNQLKALRSPYPLQPTGIASLLALLKSVDWTAPALARDLNVNEVAAVLDAWPFTMGITPVALQRPVSLVP